MDLEKKDVFESKELEKYKINWRDKNTGDIVHGDFMDKEVVKVGLEKLKKERPRIHYLW